MGLRRKEIAELISITSETAKQYISSLLDKLNVTDRAQPATEAIRRGVILLKDHERKLPPDLARVPSACGE